MGLSENRIGRSAEVRTDYDGCGVFRGNATFSGGRVGTYFVRRSNAWQSAGRKMMAQTTKTGIGLLQMLICKSQILLPVKIFDIVSSRANVIANVCVDGVIDFRKTVIRQARQAEQFVNR